MGVGCARRCTHEMPRQVSVAAVRRGGADASGLELVVADLTSDDGWSAALKGVEEVHHVASPIPSTQPKDPDELIVPARRGGRAGAEGSPGCRRTQGGADLLVRRGGVFAEGGPGLHRGGLDRPRYARAGALPALQGDRRARRVELHRNRGRRYPAGGHEPDVHRRPALVPALRSTLSAFTAIIEGTMPALPRQRFGVVDVRDVAGSAHHGDGHSRRRREALPAVGGRPDDRLGVELAQILHDHLGPPAGASRPTRRLVRTWRP